MFFEGDQSPLNPARYLPTPFHTKLAQQRTPLSQYTQQEAVGTRMRRWERPLHDFLLPYLRGAAERLTGRNWIPAEVEHKRDLDTLADMMTYLRALNGAAERPEERRRAGPSPAGTYKCLRARAGEARLDGAMGMASSEVGDPGRPGQPGRVPGSGSQSFPGQNGMAASRLRPTGPVAAGGAGPYWAGGVTLRIMKINLKGPLRGAKFRAGKCRKQRGNTMFPTFHKGFITS